MNAQPGRAPLYAKVEATLISGIARAVLTSGSPLPPEDSLIERFGVSWLEAEPISSLLEKKYGLPLVEAEYQLEAVTADEHVAQALEVTPGSPMFLIERTSYCDGPKPIDYEKLYYRGDLIKFATRTLRRPRQNP